MLRRINDFVTTLPFWLIAVTMAAGGIACIVGCMLWFGATFDYTLQSVLTGSILLGIVTGVLGCFVTLKRQSLVGDVLAHAALPGVVIAFLIAGSGLSVLLVGAAIAGWLGLQVVSLILDTTRLKQDTALGIVLATFFGLGISILSYTQGREDAGRVGLDKFFFGQAATILGSDVLIISGITVIVLVIIIAFWKEFTLSTFDPEFAMTNGFAVRMYDLLLSSLVTITIVTGLQLAGVVLMAGMLVAPAVAARQWTDDLGEMVILSAIFGAIAGGLGAMLSGIGWGRPTGPMIIALAAMITFGSLVIAPARGMLWDWLQRWLDRHRFETENLLSDLYRFAERNQKKDYVLEEKLLIGLRGWFAYIGLRDLQRNGLITRKDSGWALTDEGYSRAEAEHQKRVQQQNQENA